MKNNVFGFALMACPAGFILTDCDKTPEQKAGGVKQEGSDAKAEYLAAWEKINRSLKCK